jgi:probable rRNA maturation factor
MNRVSVIILEKRFEKFKIETRRTVFKTLEILNKKSLEVEIYLAGGRKMRELNKKFRGKDKAASVLSFPEPKNFVSPPSKFRKIGEIYLNAHSSFLASHYSLLIHGILHLLGYNHKKKSDRIKMEKTEQEILLTIDR